jgi:pyridoxamine 5'-phosphate oxidase
MEVFGDLAAIQDFSWQQLQKAPHQRTPVLASMEEPATASVRTVVLRRAIPADRMLRFFTDSRSGKMKAVAAGYPLSWLFYHPQKEIQLRIVGLPQILLPAAADEVWSQLSVAGRSAYAATAAPGSRSSLPSDSLPPDFFDRPLNQTEAARENFRVIDTIVHSLEFLQLHRQGHRRARYTWDSGQANWVGEWLVP